MNNNAAILIIGAGSIGERHIRNLWTLGYRNLTVFRQRNLPFRDIGAAKVNILTEWEDVKKLKPAIAFICTPTSLHMKQAIDCLRQDMHVFAEKPLSHNLTGIKDLEDLVKEKNKLLQVGYMMRYHPHIKKIKYLTENSIYGKLISFHTHWGSSVTAWHTYEDYRNSYAARKEYGGGVALTLSHDIDIANWIAGAEVKNCSKIFNYVSSLEIDVESVADFIIEYTNGITGSVHLNYLEKRPRRKYEFIFEEATVIFDFFADSLTVRTQDSQEVIMANDFDKNDHFIEEIKDFFQMIDSETKYIDHSLRQIRESETIIKMCMENETAGIS